MSKFEECGFLADDDLNFLPALKKNYGQYLDICLTLNSCAQKLQYTLNIYNEDSAELLSATLFSRVLSTYQAAILLSQKGMKQQVKIMLRCILEPFFPLAAVAKDKTFALNLIDADECERYKSFNKIIRYKERNKIEDTELEIARTLAAESKVKIDENNLRPISVYECAEKAGMENWYDTLYSYMSNTLHSSVRSLEEAFHMDKDGPTILALKNEPEIDEMDALFYTLSECLIGAIVAISDVFGIPVPLEVENSTKELQLLRG